MSTYPPGRRSTPAPGAAVRTCRSREMWLYNTSRARRGARTPHPVHQLLDRYRMAGVGGKPGQQASAPSTAEVDELAANAHLDLTEDPELSWSMHSGQSVASMQFPTAMR